MKAFTTIAGSLALFITAMGLCIGLVIVNASLSPELVWFPLPLIAVLVAVTVWSEQRFGIGLRNARQTSARSTGRSTAMAAGIAVAGVAACVLQGALSDLTLSAEAGPANTSALFQFSYAVLLSVAPAVLAEVAFRGLMQSRLEALWGTWPAILVITTFNTASHRWGDDLAAQWLGYFAALAGLGWLRSVTGSLWPPLLTHVLANLVTALALWRFGPFVQGAIGGAGLIALAAVMAGGVLMAHRAARSSADRAGTDGQRLG